MVVYSPWQCQAIGLVNRRNLRGMMVGSSFDDFEILSGLNYIKIYLATLARVGNIAVPDMRIRGKAHATILGQVRHARKVHCSFIED